MLCSALSVVADQRTVSALWIALFAAFAVLIERVPAVRRRPVLAALVEAAFAGLAVAGTDGSGSPMLPYLLAPGLAMGLAGTVRDVVIVGAASAVGLAVGRLGPDSDNLTMYVTTSAEWVLLGLAFGMVAGWAQRVTVHPPADRYVEAHELLEQLRRVTRRLPGGLDVASAADALLQACADQVPSARSAILVQPAPGSLVPAAVRGTARVPWRTPLTEPGPLQQAWDSGEPVVDRRVGDAHGRRRGSELTVLPLLSDDGPFGLVILESFQQGYFDAAQVSALRTCVAEGSLRLETAMLFAEVRSTVTVEEHDRLAREMHDGVAQELASVGYQLDSLRGQAVKVDAGLGEALTDVRSGLTRLMSDIRLSITDLKTSVGNERGLGAALTSYVRAVGAGRQVVVHLSLQESPFRLSGDQEVVLFQIAQVVAQDVRRSRQAANLWVTLEVDPPSARLLVEHDGELAELDDLDLSAYDEHLSRLGGALHVTRRAGCGVRVEAVLNGGARDGEGPAGR